MRDCSIEIDDGETQKLIAEAYKRVAQLDQECREIEARLGCIPKSKVLFNDYRATLLKIADAWVAESLADFIAEAISRDGPAYG